MATPVPTHVLEVEGDIARSAAGAGPILLDGIPAPGPAIDRLAVGEVVLGVVVGPVEDIGLAAQDGTIVGVPDDGHAVPLGGVKKKKELVSQTSLFEPLLLR